MSEPSTTPIPNTPAPPAVIPPPASGSTIFTQEQVDAVVTAARREEKSKLYADLEQRGGRIKTLETEIDNLKKDLGDAKKGSEKALELEGQLKALESKFDRAIEDTFTSVRTETEKRFEKQSLEDYRSTLIASANGGVIPELVTGSTREEILASFTASKARLETIESAAAAKREEQLRNEFKGKLPSSEVPGSTPPEGSADVAAWRKLSPQDWENKKSEIKKTAFEAAGLSMKSR